MYISPTNCLLDLLRFYFCVYQFLRNWNFFWYKTSQVFFTSILFVFEMSSLFLILFVDYFVFLILIWNSRIINYWNPHVYMISSIKMNSLWELHNLINIWFDGYYLLSVFLHNFGNYSCTLDFSRCSLISFS